MSVCRAHAKNEIKRRLFKGKYIYVILLILWCVWDHSIDFHFYVIVLTMIFYYQTNLCRNWRQWAIENNTSLSKFLISLVRILPFDSTTLNTWRTKHTHTHIRLNHCSNLFRLIGTPLTETKRERRARVKENAIDELTERKWLNVKRLIFLNTFNLAISIISCSYFSYLNFAKSDNYSLLDNTENQRPWNRMMIMMSQYENEWNFAWSGEWMNFTYARVDAYYHLLHVCFRLFYLPNVMHANMSNWKIRW